MIMITLSTFLATLVIHLYFRGDRNGSVPAFLRRIVIEGIGRLVYVRQRIPLPDVKKPVVPCSPRGTSVKGRSKPTIPEHVGNKFFLNYTPTAEDSRVGYYGANNRLRPDCIQGACPQMYGGGPPFPQAGKVMGPMYPSYFDTVTCSCMGPRDGCEQPTTVNEPVASQRPSKKNHRGLVPTPGKAQAGESDDSPDLLESTVTLERDVREVKRYVKMFVNRQKEIHRKSLIAMEWRTLALVLDRLFFFLYITTIGIAVLVSVPRSTEPVLKAEFLHSE
ncbi:hypothetical protein X801_04833, partial [Opisthorchis viverrini]